MPIGKLLLSSYFRSPENGFYLPQMFRIRRDLLVLRESQHRVERLIKAPADTPGTAFICNECVAICVEVLAEQAKKQAAR